MNSRNVYPIPLIGCFLAIIFVLIINEAHAEPTFTDQNWTAIGGIPGTDGAVRAATADATGNLYIGGDFIVAGNTSVMHVAKWDGNRCSALGGGLNGSVNAITLLGNDVYVGGNFSLATNNNGTVINVSCIAKWDGNEWSALGNGMNASVKALTASGAFLYAGGDFTTAGGIAANRVAQWNGSAWSAVGGGMNNSVSSLLVSGNDLYAGGSFTNAGGIVANRVAVWNGSNWAAMGSGTDGPVLALVMVGTNLYVGGSFSMAGGVSGRYSIARWNGTAWFSVGTGTGGNVYALAASGNDLYVGGDFSSAGGSTSCRRIAKWNGATWSALQIGVSGGNLTTAVSAIAILGANIYSAGEFTSASGLTAYNIVCWNGAQWSALQSGPNGSVSAMAASGDDLFVGGTFSMIGSNRVNYVAKWDGNGWARLGRGFNGSVSEIAAFGTNVFAAGNFTRATNETGETVYVQRIARWDGSNWSALGGGVDQSVSALIATDSGLYAGGDFSNATNASGECVPASFIAKWDGTNWSALGGGVNDSVWALISSGSNLYAGGMFVQATNSSGEPVNANRIALWNGNVWTNLAGGVNGSVSSIAVLGTNVYVGGDFIRVTNVSGNSLVASNIARWDGANWSAVGSGLNNGVSALTIAGDDLYVAGSFTNAGPIKVNRIARWNGSGWSALGSGTDNSILALAAVRGDLFCGGYFTKAGNKGCFNFAKADISMFCPLELKVVAFTNVINISWPSTYSSGILESSLNFGDIPQWSVLPSIDCSASIPIEESNRFFRVRMPQR